MKSMSNIPCKNCITFALCNAQMSDDFPCTDLIDNLLPKCSIIKDYTEYYNRISLKSDLVVKVAKFFKPKAYY